MFRSIRQGLALAALLSLPAIAFAAESSDPQKDTLLVKHPEIVVSATRTPRNQLNIPNATSVVTRADLRPRATRTLAEALQDVVGIDTGEGSDNGSRIPNVGMWGLKEFDALLFTLNGVPVGGPFNPSLAQIPVEDIDRVEIVKGPQGTMYGVSAFAGMIQVFTPEAQDGGEVTLGGGSFTEGHGNFSWGKTLSEGRDLRLTGSYARTDGWQDRTESNVVRGGVTYGFGLGAGHMTVDVVGLSDEQDWGSPLPFAQGQLVPGFVIDRNYAVGGAEVGHQVFGGNTRLTWPLGGRNRIENTLNYTYDSQDFVRSFADTVAGDTLISEGLELEPKESALYEDLRMVTHFDKGGAHELVTGAALTFGKTKGEGREFEVRQLMSQYPNIPNVDDIPSAEDREFEDERTFIGVYAHDAWTPKWWLTVEGGGRFDAVHEELETEADLPTGPVPVKDEKEDSKFSGDLAATVRLVPEGGVNRFQAVNLYGSLRTGFKPAAPNLAEAEAAEILDPETTQSWEIGMKARALQSVTLNLSYFDMTFNNMVVSIVGAGGLPELTNAGEQRFRGFESDLRWTPPAIPGAAIDFGYAHHNARFVDFTFVSDGALVDVSGNRLELVPADLVNVRASLKTPKGIGGFVGMRYQGERPYNRRNTFFADAFTEWDAGLSFDRDAWHVAAVGRNLGDDRHVVTESEIGDAQLYVAPPARFTVEVGYRF
jgi:iron complex outermembrane recepter protein